MKEKDHQLIWKDIEAQTTAEEKQYVQYQLDRDSQFRETYQQNQQLHQALNHLDPYQPSMRFVKNIMEQLPSLNTPLNIAPIVPPQFLRNILLGLFALFTLVLIAIWEPYMESTAVAQPNLKVTLQVVHFFNSVPKDVYLTIASVAIATLLFLSLDQFVSPKLKSVKS